MNKIVDNYQLIEIIGSGQYGKVYRGKNITNDQVVAIKVMKQEKFREVPKLHEFTQNEIQTLTKISNPNCVKFTEMLKTQNNTYLIYEFCNGGTLEQAIHRKKFLSEGESVKILAQLLNAFKCMIKENILHRDLKPSNILFHNGIIKIADFGFCKSLVSAQDMTATMVGSPIYMAPEILKGMPYNTKADIWSLGVVFFECLFGYCPYEDQNIAKLISQIDNKELQIPRYINSISKKAEELIRAMLIIDHRKRIDWMQLISLTEEKFHISIGSAYLSNNSYLNQPQVQQQQQQQQQAVTSPTTQNTTGQQQLLMKKNSSSNLGITSPGSQQSNNQGNTSKNVIGAPLCQSTNSNQQSNTSNNNTIFTNGLSAQVGLTGNANILSNNNPTNNIGNNGNNQAIPSSNNSSSNQQLGFNFQAPSKNTGTSFLDYQNNFNASQANSSNQGTLVNGVSPLSANKDLLNVMSPSSNSTAGSTLANFTAATAAASTTTTTSTQNGHNSSNNHFGTLNGLSNNLSTQNQIAGGLNSNKINSMNNGFQFNTIGGGNNNNNNNSNNQNQNLNGNLQPGQLTPAMSAEDKSKIVLNTRILIKERNKTVFLSHVLSNLMERPISSTKTPIVAFLITKQIGVYFEQQKACLNNLKNTSLAKKMERIELFETSNEIKKYKGIITREMGFIASIVDAFKTEILRLIKSSPSFMENTQLKAELSSPLIIDQGFYQASFIAYIDDAFTKAKELNIALQEMSPNIPQYTQFQETTMQVLSHVNEMLDALMIEEFFETFIEVNVKYSDQQYFENIRKYSPDALQELVAHKFDYIREKQPAGAW